MYLYNKPLIIRGVLFDRERVGIDKPEFISIHVINRIMTLIILTLTTLVTMAIAETIIGEPSRTLFIQFMLIKFLLCVSSAQLSYVVTVNLLCDFLYIKEGFNDWVKARSQCYRPTPMIQELKNSPDNFKLLFKARIKVIVFLIISLVLPVIAATCSSWARYIYSIKL